MRIRVVLPLLLPFLALVAIAACGAREDYWDGSAEIDSQCRVAPRDCFGTVGGECVLTDDCDDGVCCRDKNCGGGMCTYLCYGNPDCPPEMACEHGYCFFRCSRDSDCAAGQKCEHGDTVCEYDGG